MAIRLIYVDDSGSPREHWITYSWMELRFEEWHGVLGSWLAWRKELAASQDRIPASFEFHTAAFVGGRHGSPSLAPTWPSSRRIPVLRNALNAINNLPAMRLGTVYRNYPAGSRVNDQRAEAYRALLEIVDRRLRAAGDLGMIIMDGDGTDPLYRMAHRDLSLADRRIVEDPSFHHSHVAQLVQVVDIVAWFSFRNLKPTATSAPFVQTFFEKYLLPRHVEGGPVEV